MAAEFNNPSQNQYLGPLRCENIRYRRKDSWRRAMGEIKIPSQKKDASKGVLCLAFDCHS
jgi:hypothetical protein